MSNHNLDLEEIFEAVCKYAEQVQLQALKQNKCALILDDIDECAVEMAMEEDDFSLSNFLKSIRFAYISQDASTFTQAFYAEMSAVVDEVDGYVVTSTGPKFQFVFEQALQAVMAVWKENNIRHCADLLIAILATLRCWPHGFYDCDNHEEALSILNTFGSFWSKVMTSSMKQTLPQKMQTKITSYFSPIQPNSNDSNRSKKAAISDSECKPVPDQRFDETVAYPICTQYLRRAEKAFDLNILVGTEIGNVVSQYVTNGVMLDKGSKKVLYDVLKEVNEEMMEMGYTEGFEYGDVPNDIQEVQYETKRTFYALYVRDNKKI